MARVVGMSNGIANADGVAHDDVALQLFDLVAFNHAVFEGAKAGRDTVGHHVIVEQALDGCGGALHAVGCSGRNADVRGARLAIGHGDHLFKGEGFAVEENIRAQTWMDL